MGDKTAIEWTDATWNPVSGCTKVSTGCKFCYAERVSKRMGQEFTKITLHPNRLKTPVHWRKARRIFVCSMSDLFHKDVPDHFLDKVWAIMYQTPEHTYQVLTKRPERMREYVQSIGMKNTEHIWLGVSCENQEQADKRIPLLLQTPAAVRFVSLEPLLGPIDLSRLLHHSIHCATHFRMNQKIRERSTFPHRYYYAGEPDGSDCPRIHRAIVGGESGGPPERALVEKCRGLDG